jgi:hypothetical protein
MLTGATLTTTNMLKAGLLFRHFVLLMQLERQGMEIRNAVTRRIGDE